MEASVAIERTVWAMLLHAVGPHSERRRVGRRATILNWESMMVVRTCRVGMWIHSMTSQDHSTLRDQSLPICFRTRRRARSSRISSCERGHRGSDIRFTDGLSRTLLGANFAIANDRSLRQDVSPAEFQGTGRQGELRPLFGGEYATNCVETPRSLVRPEARNEPAAFVNFVPCVDKDHSSRSCIVLAPRERIAKKAP